MTAGDGDDDEDLFLTAWGPIDDDLVGTASARLLASGRARRDRLEALNLLGLLIDHADADDVVRLPLSVLAGEFGVAGDRGKELLEALVAVEVVHDLGEGIVVGCSSPANMSGFRLSRYLTNVATVLDNHGDARAESAKILPSPVPLAPLTRRGRRRDLGRAVLPRVLAGAAAAFVVMWSSAAPSGESTPVRTVAGASSSTGRAPWATTPPPPVATSLSAPAADRTATPGAPPSAPALPPAPVQGVEPGPSSTPFDERASGQDRPFSPPDGDSEDPDQPLPAPDLASPRPRSPRPGRSAPLQGDPSGPPVPSRAGTPGGSGSSCPAGRPEAMVVEHRLLPGVARGLLDVVAEPGTEVRGTMDNPTGEDLVVGTFEIVVGAGIAGSPSPLAVPAGTVVAWRVELPSGMALPATSVVEVRILDWSWSDPVVEALCPSR